MAGISNLSIAVQVIRAAPGLKTSGSIGEIDGRIRAFRETLISIGQESGKVPPSKDRRPLLKFFKELQRQAEIERDAAIGVQERPAVHLRLLK
jgi:hypothetical protein